MPPVRPVRRSILDEFHHRMGANERELQKLKNQPTTHPIYDPDFPDDAVNTQIAFRDGTPYYYWDGGVPGTPYSVDYWHPFTADAGADWPVLYNIPILLPPVGEDTTNWNNFTADSANFGGGYREVTDVNTSGAYFTTLLRLGPHGSIWQISSIYNEFNQAGKLRFELASVEEDWPSAGLADNTGLVQGSDLDGAVYVGFSAGQTRDMSGVALIRNVRNAKNPDFRVMGQSGDPLTAITAATSPDSDYYGNTIDGGPGLYRLKTIIDAAGSIGGKYGGQLVALVVHRVDYLGF